MPKTDEFLNQAGNPQSNFEGGYITWDPKCQTFIPFDYQGYSRDGLDDCSSAVDPLEGFINFIDAVTGVRTNLETLDDPSASRLEKDIAEGELVLTFVPGGIVVKAPKYAKSAVIPAEKLALAASKELTTAQRSLINVLQRIRFEKAVEKLGGKLALEYWDKVEDMVVHFEKHAAEFWPGISVEEYTAIGKEALENVKKLYPSPDYPGQYIARDKVNKVIVFTNKSKDKIYSIFRESEQYIENLIRKGVISDE